MKEIFGIFADITNGNLPPSEFGGFAVYLIGRLFWPLVILIAAVAVGFVLAGG